MHEHLRNLIYEQAVEAGFGVEAKDWPFGYSDVLTVAAAIATPKHVGGWPPCPIVADDYDHIRQLLLRAAIERLALLAGHSVSNRRVVS